jgi:hypothetical protein
LSTTKSGESFRDCLGEGESQSSDDAVSGVCSTRCMEYSVYAILGVCGTCCMLYSVSTHDLDRERQSGMT